MFKKILVGVDGSENGKRALETAKIIAKDGDRRVTLIHVVQPLYQTTGPYGGYTDLSTLIADQEAAGRALLESAKDELAASGIEADTHLVVGRRGPEICKVAESGEYDLIVVGRRGITRLEEALLGSVSEYVIRHGKLPVLIVQ